MRELEKTKSEIIAEFMATLEAYTSAKKPEMRKMLRNAHILNTTRGFNRLLDLAFHQGKIEQLKEDIEILYKKKHQWDKPIEEMPSDWWHYNDSLQIAIEALQEKLKELQK